MQLDLFEHSRDVMLRNDVVDALRRREPVPEHRLRLVASSAFIAYNAIIDRNKEEPVASITIRNLDEQTKAQLRVRAAHHGRSMEEEARNILREVVCGGAVTRRNLAEAIRRRFEAFGGCDIELPAREAMRTPPIPGK